jgi:hypothetical protein
MQRLYNILDSMTSLEFNTNQLICSPNETKDLEQFHDKKSNKRVYQAEYFYKIVPNISLYKYIFR